MKTFQKQVPTSKTFIYALYLLSVAYILATIFPAVLSQCDQNCVDPCVVTGTGQCDGDCAVGTGPKVVNNKRICLNCTTNCDGQCNTNGGESCDVCAPSYGLNKTITPPTCSPCADNCGGGCRVAGAGSCDNCSGSVISRFGIDNSTGISKCGPCDVNCVDAMQCSVSGAGKCDGECKAGYGLVAASKVCQLCDPNCKVGCSTQGGGKCDGTCLPGTALDTTTHTCGSCTTNCLECNTNGAGKCDPGKCFTGLGINSTLQCAQCSDNCKSCPNSGAGLCDECVAGYVLLTDKKCGRCDPFCKGGCDNTGVDKCDGECRFGTIKIANNTCLPCQNSTVCFAGCNVTGPGNCDPGACAPGYGYNETIHKCQACDANCNSTGTPGGCATAGAGKCDTGGCKGGYGSTSDMTCANCTSNCVSCQNSNEVCDQCKEGYLLTESKQCAKCQDPAICLGSCTKSGDGKCDGPCADDFALNATSQTCEACDPNCKTTANGGGCTAVGAGHCTQGGCKDDFGSTESLTCAPCDSNCKAAADGGGCSTAGGGKCDTDQCKDGFTSAADGTCQPSTTVNPNEATTAPPGGEGTAVTGPQGTEKTNVQVSGGDSTAAGTGGPEGTDMTGNQSPPSGSESVPSGGPGTPSGGPGTPSGGPGTPSGGPGTPSGPLEGTTPPGGTNQPTVSGGNGETTTKKPGKNLAGPILAGIFGYIGVMLAMIGLWYCLPRCCPFLGGAQAAAPVVQPQPVIYVQNTQPAPPPPSQNWFYRWYNGNNGQQQRPRVTYGY